MNSSSLWGKKKNILNFLFRDMKLLQLPINVLTVCLVEKNLTFLLLAIIRRNFIVREINYEATRSRGICFAHC